MTSEDAIKRLKEGEPFSEIYNKEWEEAKRMAIKALEQEPVLDKIRAEINSPNRGTCDYFIVDRIEEIINKYIEADKEEQNMTNEEAASYFEKLIECADCVDASYADCVKVEAIRTAFKALKERKTAQDATEATETPEFHEGELIVYQNGDTFQIGEIKRLCEEGAFVYYHEGDTASLTPFENMHKLQNAYCIKQTSFALDRPRCGNCKYFCICSNSAGYTAAKSSDDASECDKYTEE